MSVNFLEEIDRNYKKKNILIVGQLSSSLVALGIAIAISLGAITWVHLVVASLLQGTVMSLMMPSRQAIIYELVGEGSLMNAIALNAAAMNLLRLSSGSSGNFALTSSTHSRLMTSGGRSGSGK